ncbi:14385_t:CDS:2 [Dentiscutata erythropus]|uniref:14385_t:CDS:1 n=1 Tax=Dentiscutata erythropus TaxID=1348616 RepID=A0A9N9G6L0_9GLOM|nr:14385_t:CDS:2 [Dentiscutata erythropus]
MTVIINVPLTNNYYKYKTGYACLMYYSSIHISAYGTDLITLHRFEIPAIAQLVERETVVRKTSTLISLGR